jgi:hypothetical protein
MVGVIQEKWPTRRYDFILIRKGYRELDDDGQNVFKIVLISLHPLNKYRSADLELLPIANS